MTTIQAFTTDTFETVTAVGAFIDEFFAEKRADAAVFGPRYSALWGELAAEASGGKRIRPALLTSTAAGLTTTPPPGTVAVAAAFELLHTAFLMHDDVIDNDTVRRGRPNLMGTMIHEAEALPHEAAPRPAASWGQASAILGGDLLIHAAQAMIARAEVDDSMRSNLLDLFDRIMFTTAAGELDDVAFSTVFSASTLAEVLAVSERKTAAYSFQGPLVAGAILAGADPSTRENLDRIGIELGIAFQLRDDILGVFGRPDITGKSTESDLRNLTMTPLLFMALQNDATGHVHDLVETIRAGGQADVGSMQELMRSTKALDLVTAQINEHAAAAEQLIADSHLPRELTTSLLRFVGEAKERQL